MAVHRERRRTAVRLRRGLGVPSRMERQPDVPPRQPAAARAAARCRRTARARRDPAAARIRLHGAGGVLLMVRPRPRRHGRALPPLAALAAEPRARRPAGDAQYMGGGVFRPRRGHAHRARRSGREGGRGALRARRRLVPPAPRRHEERRRLDCRPRGVAQWTRCARQACAQPGHAVRPVVRARDDQPRLRLRARAPRLDPRRPEAVPCRGDVSYRTQYVLDP